MAIVLLDSSVVIAIQRVDDRHHKKVLQALASLSAAPAISALTLSEVLVHEYRDNSKTADLAAGRLAEAFSQIYPVSAAVAIMASQIRSERDLGLADSVISATARLEGAELWTCDKGLAKAHAGARLLA